MTFIARDIDTINAAMIADKETRTELDVLTNESATAIWINLLKCFAVEANIIESEIEDIETDVERRGQEIISGTLPWIQYETLMYQHGDSLDVIDGNVTYAVIDETKRVVKLSASEVLNGIIIVKGAKLDINDNPEPLSVAELSGLTQYWVEKRFAGASYNVISIDGDEMHIAARIEVDSQKISLTGESQTTPGSYPVEDAIKAYWKNLGVFNFNGRFVLMNLIDTVQLVDGVKNIVVTICRAKQNGSASYTNVLADEGNAYNTVSGYLIEDSSYLLSDTLTYAN